MKSTVSIVLPIHYPNWDPLSDTFVFYIIYTVIQLNMWKARKFVAICSCKGEISWRGEIEQELEKSGDWEIVHSFLLSYIHS